MLSQLIAKYKPKNKMTSKIPNKKIPKIIFKSWFKFMFLTKNFKQKNQCHVLETFSKCND
jgi:hypothetical protein